MRTLGRPSLHRRRRPAEPSPPRRRRQRWLRRLSALLIAAGIVLLADVGITLAWQEPFSGLYARFQQGQLEDQFERLETGGPTAAERRALARIEADGERLAFMARSLRRRTGEGDAIGRIRAPEAGIDEIIVEGTGTGDLRKGPGHYGRTPLPGAPGTVAIAGHRTTYGAPFNDVDDLERGDRITVEMPYGDFVYAVEGTRIVKPTNVGVIRRVDHDRLVLTACHPKYSAAKRIVVFAELVRATPVDGRTSRGRAS